MSEPVRTADDPAPDPQWVPRECRAVLAPIRAALADSLAATVVVDVTGRYVWVNAACARLLGRTAQDLIGLRFADLSHPDNGHPDNGHPDDSHPDDSHPDDVAAEAAERAAVLAGTPQRSPTTLRYRRPDGTLVRGRTTVTALRTPDGTAQAVLAQINSAQIDAAQIDAAQIDAAQIDDLPSRQDVDELHGRHPRAGGNDLLAAQRYTRSLIEASLDPLVTISAEGKITDVNEATVRATGAPRDRLIGSDFADYFTEPEKARAGYREVFAHGYVVNYPLALRHVSGGVLDVLYNASLYRDGEGNVAGAFAAARDVTERNRAEASARRLAAIVESSDDAIIAKSLDGTILTWNPGAERLYGYTAEEIVGQSITVLVPPQLREEFWDLMRRAARGAHVAHVETTRLPRHGPPLDISLSTSPLVDAQGQVVGVSTIARDITERKRAERELRAASAYNRSLIEASLDPLVTIEPGGAITDINAATEQVTGCSRDELVGTDFSAYFTDPDLARAGYERVFRDGTVRDYALELRHRDGRTTPVLYNASLYRDDSGQVLGVFAAARDVTRQRAAEAEVRALNTELETRVRLRTRDLEQATRNMEAFTYSVSHDLRAPLRALSGFSEALLEDYADTLDETGRDYARRIAAAAQRMAQLIDDLLHLSRVSRAQIRPTTVDLSAEVSSIAEELRRREPLRRSRFLVTPGVRATADPQLIRTVLENLVGNAWKFTSRLEEAVIEFGSLPTAEAEICCYVRDNGAGFDATYVDKLFQPFQRLHTSQQFPGNGIGLVSARRIVERHGGRTWAQGEVDHGATIYFTLNAGTKGPP